MMNRATVTFNDTAERGHETMTSIPEDLPLRDKIIAVLRSIYDPEIPVNLYDLGLIYEINIDGRDVSISMTLTTPHCPVAGSMPAQVEAAVREIEDVDNVSVELTWNPPWTPDKLSDEVKLTLGLL